MMSNMGLYKEWFFELASLTSCWMTSTISSRNFIVGIRGGTMNSLPSTSVALKG